MNKLVLGCFAAAVLALLAVPTEAQEPNVDPDVEVRADKDALGVGDDPTKQGEPSGLEDPETNAVLDPKDNLPEERTFWRHHGGWWRYRPRRGRGWGRRRRERQRQRRERREKKRKQRQKKRRQARRRRTLRRKMVGETFLTEDECADAEIEAVIARSKSVVRNAIASYLSSKADEIEDLKDTIPDLQSCSELCRCVTCSTSGSCRKIPGRKQYRCTCGLKFDSGSFLTHLRSGDGHFCQCGDSATPFPTHPTPTTPTTPTTEAPVTPS